MYRRLPRTLHSRRQTSLRALESRKSATSPQTSAGNCRRTVALGRGGVEGSRVRGPLVKAPSWGGGGREPWVSHPIGLKAQVQDWVLSHCGGGGGVEGVPSGLSECAGGYFRVYVYVTWLSGGCFWLLVGWWWLSGGCWWWLSGGGGCWLGGGGCLVVVGGGCWSVWQLFGGCLPNLKRRRAGRNATQGA